MALQFAPVVWVSSTTVGRGVAPAVIGCRPQGLAAHERRVAGVLKEEFQRRRFDVAGAKEHVGLAEE